MWTKITDFTAFSLLNSATKEGEGRERIYMLAILSRLYPPLSFNDCLHDVVEQGSGATAAGLHRDVAAGEPLQHCPGSERDRQV